MFLLHYKYWGKLFLRNSNFKLKLFSYVEVKSSSPFLHFYLPTFQQFSTFPIYPTFLLSFPSVVPYIPLSLSTFPSQPSRSLLFLFPTYLLPYLPPSLPIHFPLFRSYPFPLIFSLPLSAFSFPFSFPFHFPFPSFSLLLGL